MEEKKKTVFRQKTIERISSPDQLADYLQVTSPGVWVILAAVILLLAGLFAWSAVGTLETNTDVRVVVQDHAAEVIPLDSSQLSEGMPLRVAGREFIIISAKTDEYGRSVGLAEVMLPNGAYNGTVVTETVHPIRFLLESR